MNGPLTGTDVNLSGRMAVCTKSPLTGTVTDSHHGGWSAARLKWAGFDGLVFKGKAGKPVYAYVEDGKVTLHDASDLWGKHVHETIKILQERHGGDKDLSVITIGPAGENLVKFACWMNENDRASGRGGTGCVGGSKNLKAIVIKGKHANRPRPADKEAFKAAQKVGVGATLGRARHHLAAQGRAVGLRHQRADEHHQQHRGACPRGTARRRTFGEHAEMLSGEYVKAAHPGERSHLPRLPGRLQERGRGQGRAVQGPHGERRVRAGLVGGRHLRQRRHRGGRLHDRSRQRLRLSTPSRSAPCWRCTWSTPRRGYANGDGLAWGDTHGMVEMARKIAFREGIGDILAEGTGKAAKKLGHPELAMACKDQGIPAYDPRGIKGMGLGYATSNRGACHLRGYTPAAEVVGNVLGPRTVVDPLAWEGKGNLIMIFQNVHTITDCLDVCKFATFAESLDGFAAQFAAITGKPCTAGDLLKAGERVYNLERYYNNLNGFREGSDTLPKRFLKEPSTWPGSKGQVCELDKMLEEYYELRGWVNGVVPEAKLKELEII